MLYSKTHYYNRDLICHLGGPSHFQTHPNTSDHGLITYIYNYNSHIISYYYHIIKSRLMIWE